MRRKMAKFEGSIYFTSKVTALFWKVPTKAFVNHGQCPCKSVKTENEKIYFDITSRSILKNWKMWKNSPFFPISRLSWNMTFWEIWDKIQERTNNIELILYSVTKCYHLASFWPMIFTKIAKFLQNYDVQI